MEEEVFLHHILGPGLLVAIPGLCQVVPLLGTLSLSVQLVPLSPPCTLLRLTHPSSRLFQHFAQLATISSARGPNRAIFPGDWVRAQVGLWEGDLTEKSRD